MRKCVSCGQWMGHVLCLKGRPEQCKDCVAVPIQVSPSTTLSPTVCSRVAQHYPAESGSPSRECPTVQSDQCSCRICVIRYSTYTSDSSSDDVELTSNASERSEKEKLSVSSPQTLLDNNITSKRSLMVSIPLKSLPDQPDPCLRVSFPKSCLQPLLQSPDEQSQSDCFIETSAMKALVRQHAGVKVLSSVSIPRYSPQQLMRRYKQKS